MKLQFVVEISALFLQLQKQLNFNVESAIDLVLKSQHLNINRGCKSDIETTLCNVNSMQLC